MRKIYCPIHWPIPKQLSQQISTETKDIYHTILSIPCDQRNNIEDMKHIISVIINLEK